MDETVQSQGPNIEEMYLNLVIKNEETEADLQASHERRHALNLTVRHRDGYINQLEQKLNLIESRLSERGISIDELLADKDNVTPIKATQDHNPPSKTSAKKATSRKGSQK